MSKDFFQQLAGSVLLVAFLTVSLQADEPQASREYAKREVRIAMRDGVTLHTTIYEPKDQSARYPILLQRTPYGCNPYGTASREPIMYNQHLVESGYIFVYQDLRSRSMSDGGPRFENLKPAYSKLEPSRTDEITDAFDTIQWLLENLENHNEHVGTFGSSYMGFTSLMAAASGHPNLKAVLSGAPCVDNYFEDFGRNGMFTLAYTPILDWFGTEKHERHTGPWWENNLEYWADGKRFGLAKDSYQFYLQFGALKNFDRLIPEQNYFWNEIRQHPNYDDFRKSRNVLQYLRDISTPVLVVGGWNDEQNLYGTLRTFETLQRFNPKSQCQLVMGPWAHSGHKRVGESRIGDIHYGMDLVDKYQQDVEFVFFEKHLKNAASEIPFSQKLFDTGTKLWRSTDAGESSTPSESIRMSLLPNERLAEAEEWEPNRAKDYVEYLSDPSKPVPYIESDEFSLFPARAWMTADQRFAYKRPDVLTFVSEPLTADWLVRGPVDAKLRFSTSQSDADVIVKLIDVYPMDRLPETTDAPGVKMNGYQQLVRCGQIRGRFRDSYAEPRPFRPGEIDEVSVELLDVCHTFRRDHRIMVQIQSSLFPLFDRNPQRYVDNIFFAEDEDFVSAMHRIYKGSYLQISVVKTQ